MIKTLIRSILMTSMILLGSSCGDTNLLTELSSHDTDAAWMNEAQKKLDALAWDDAVTILTTKLTPAYQTRSDAKTLLMSSYAGKCGLLFSSLASNLPNASGNLFQLILSVYADASVNVPACDSAIAVLNTFGTSAQRTVDQNLFAALLGLTKVGAQLHTKFDTENSGFGNGTVDLGWDSCTSSPLALRLTDAEVVKAITGIGMLFQNLTAVTASLGSSGGTTDIASAKTACETAVSLPSPTPISGSCDIIDEATTS